MTVSVVEYGRPNLLIDLLFPTLKNFPCISEVKSRVQILKMIEELVLIFFTFETINDCRNLILVALNDLVNIANEVLIDVQDVILYVSFELFKELFLLLVHSLIEIPNVAGWFEKDLFHQHVGLVRLKSPLQSVV